MLKGMVALLLRLRSDDPTSGQKAHGQGKGRACSTFCAGSGPQPSARTIERKGTTAPLPGQSSQVRKGG